MEMVLHLLLKSVKDPTNIMQQLHFTIIVHFSSTLRNIAYVTNSHEKC